MQAETASIAPTVPAAEGSIIVDSAETQLATEIGDLWHVHTEAQTSLHKTRDELKFIRANLSRRLHELKAVLSRPGRGGAWSSFLEAQRIPRSTADRLVRSHVKTLSAVGNNCASEQIPELSDATIRRYLHALWPKLSRTLTTRESIEVFIAVLRQTAEKAFGGDDQTPSSPASSSPLSDNPYQDQPI